MQHRIRGVKYTIDVDKPFLGICDPPSGKIERCIRLPGGLPGTGKYAKLALHTLLHEVLHASKWEADEKRIDQTASDIASLLWKLGYRRGTK